MRVGSVGLVALLAALGLPTVATPERLCSLGPHPTARGDVDGDGSAERVWLAGGRGVVSGCRYVLRADGPSGHWAALVVASSPPPTIPNVLNADGKPGAEINVVVDRGASSASSALYTVRAGALRRMTFGPPTKAPTILTSLSAGMAFGGADCLEGRVGTVVSAYVERLRTGFRVRRVLLRADGLRFRVVEASQRRVRRAPRIGMSFESCPP